MRTLPRAHLREFQETSSRVGAIWGRGKKVAPTREEVGACTLY
jgi:hypothetical protein